MDARGFGAARYRTYHRDVPVRFADLVFAVACLATGAAILVLAAVVGRLRLWDGRFAA